MRVTTLLRKRVPGRSMRARAALIMALAPLMCGAAAPSADPLGLANRRGQVVIVDFWASWCKPCRQSIPWLNSMRERYGTRGLTIIGVNVDAERRDADRFLSAIPVEFETVFD